MSGTSHPRLEHGDELPLDLQQLASAIERLPSAQREQLEPFFERVAAGTRRRRRILVLVQDALSQLRLDMRYLVFDLEATRRERDECRRDADDRPQSEDSDWAGPDGDTGK
jgi:hypothetical protein